MDQYEYNELTQKRKDSIIPNPLNESLPTI
jgi:hypothetical protein